MQKAMVWGRRRNGNYNYALQVLKVINVDSCGGEIKMTREEAKSKLLVEGIAGNMTAKDFLDGLEVLGLIKFEDARIFGVPIPTIIEVLVKHGYKVTKCP